MGTPSQRGQVLLECAFALAFLAIMITSIHKYMDSKKAPFWKTLEHSRIYKFNKYSWEKFK